MNDINKAKSAGSDEINDLTENLKAKGQEWVDKATERGKELLDDAQDRGRDAFKDLNGWVKKNPAAAVGCAFAVGVLLYALFRRDD